MSSGDRRVIYTLQVCVSLANEIIFVKAGKMREAFALSHFSLIHSETFISQR